MTVTAIYTVDQDDVDKLKAAILGLPQDEDGNIMALRYLLFRINQQKLGEWDHERQRMTALTPHASRIGVEPAP